MSRQRLLALASGVAALAPATGQAQGPWSASSAVFYESYAFGSGLVLHRLSELTIPIGLSYRLSTRASVDLSTGFAKADLTAAPKQSQLTDQHLTGLLDTEARLSINIIADRLVALVSGAVPTGRKQVQQDELAIIGAVSSDVIGYAAPNLGTGGNLGGGLIGAVPLGRFALGVGATFKRRMTYAPIVGQADELKPGSEMRIRGGLEGPLSRRTYLRTAVVFVRNSKDRVFVPGTGDTPRNGLGNRAIGYVSINQGVGVASLTAYGFDVFRGGPQVEETALGAALMPRGNLLAFGGRIDIPLARGVVTLAPRAEYRLSAAAADTTATTLRRVGSTVRVGADLRRTLGLAALVLRGGYLSGSVVQAGQSVHVSGYRMSLNLELTP